MLLSRRWCLWDIDDVEAFTARIVERSQLELSHHGREDLHVFLVE